MDKEKLLINNPKSNNSEVMSKKQIEEMANFFFINTPLSGLSCKIMAEKCYNAGYRKQSEGHWMTYHCTNGGKSPRGRLVTYKTYTCDSCGNSNGRHKTNFCPHCGAEMITKPKGE